MKQVSRFFLLVSIILAVFSGCAPAQPTVQETPAAETTAAAATDVLELTLDELAQYNGKDGKPAYVAIDGVIYDVTDVPPWSGGIHQGKYEAGKDHTETIKNSPHGTKVLEKLKVVGKIKQ